MTQEEQRQPATRGDVEKLAAEVREIRGLIIGDGEKRLGQAGRIRSLEEWRNRTENHIRGLWTGGLTVASVLGTYLLSRFRGDG